MTRILKNQKPLWMAARIPLLEVTPKVKRHMAKKKNPTEKETFRQKLKSLPVCKVFRVLLMKPSIVLHRVQLHFLLQ
jgi:hypothetical protein